MRPREKRVYTVEDAYRVFDGPLSEDLPDNIKEIERAVGEALLKGDLSMQLPIGGFSSKLVTLLTAKDIRPPSEWDLDNPKILHDLTLKIIERILRGESTWDWGRGEKDAERMATYDRLKDRPSVKKVIELGGVCYNSLLVIRTISKIDEILAKGGSYADAFSSIIYQDDEPSNHAFLAHAEEAFNAELSAAQLLELTKLDPSLSDEVEQTHAMALIHSYRLALAKTLREGGKHKDLVAINPEDFSLPSNTRDKMILWAIRDYFNLGEDLPSYRIPLRAIANLIEAPYSIVLAASKDPE